MKKHPEYPIRDYKEEPTLLYPERQPGAGDTRQGPDSQEGLPAPESVSDGSPQDPGDRPSEQSPAVVPPPETSSSTPSTTASPPETATPTPDNSYRDACNAAYEEEVNRAAKAERPHNQVLSLIDKALNLKVDPETMERLLALQERIWAREAEMAFNAAKGRILSKLAGIKIVKSKPVLYENEKGKPAKGLYEAFRYAPLEDIDAILAPLLAEEEMDLSYSDEPMTDGRVMIRGRLKHLPGGHHEDSLMAAPLDITGGKNNVQAVGSTNSYLRRYVVCNLFNIVVGGADDDGRSADPMLPEQVKELVALIRKAQDQPGADKIGAGFLKYMHWSHTGDQTWTEIVGAAPRSDYRKAKVTLEEHLAKQETPA